MQISETNTKKLLAADRCSVLMRNGMKRESGVNPERCSHCVREFFEDRALTVKAVCAADQSLGNREGRKTTNKVRRPACFVEF